MPPRRKPKTAKELREQYNDGVRDFSGADLSRQDLTFMSLEGVDLSSANLRFSSLGGAEFTGVCFDGASLIETQFQGSTLIKCSFKRADLTLSRLRYSHFSYNDFTGVNLTSAVLSETDFNTGDFTSAKLNGTLLVSCDIRALCRANTTLIHTGPSYVDYTTIIRSLLAPNLNDFLLRTGMPPVFVEYAIDCARAIANPVLSRVMQSTFISYGGPDAAFARKLYEALHGNGVTTFFFAEHAVPGKRLHRVMREGVNQHDRVVLICSEASLTRPGVLNEIEETLAREAREGGESFLIPIRLDNYVFSGWAPTRPDLAQAIRDRVVADFTGALDDEARFNAALLRLLSALRK